MISTALGRVQLPGKIPVPIFTLGLLLPNGAEVNDYFKDADVYPNNFWPFFWASLFAVVASKSCGGNKCPCPGLCSTDNNGYI